MLTDMAVQMQLATGAGTQDALQAATGRAEQLAQQVQSLEAKLREQSSHAADAVKVSSLKNTPVPLKNSYKTLSILLRIVLDVRSSLAVELCIRC